MSQISKALQKIAEARQKQQEAKVGGIVYLSDAPKTGAKTALMVLLGIGTIAAISMSIAAVTLSMKNAESKQMQVLTLEKTVQSQEKRINDFIIAINKNQKFTDSQIGGLNARLNEESNDIKVQVNTLASIQSTNYDSLKEAVIDDKEQINSLDNHAKTLDQKIAVMSVANAQAKDVTSPATGT